MCERIYWFCVAVLLLDFVVLDDGVWKVDRYDIHLKVNIHYTVPKYGKWNLKCFVPLRVLVDPIKWDMRTIKQYFVAILIDKEKHFYSENGWLCYMKCHLIMLERKDDDSVIFLCTTYPKHCSDHLLFINTNFICCRSQGS